MPRSISSDPTPKTDRNLRQVDGARRLLRLWFSPLEPPTHLDNLLVDPERPLLDIEASRVFTIPLGLSLSLVAGARVELGAVRHPQRAACGQRGHDQADRREHSRHAVVGASWRTRS
jgi:hypothetical protein